MSCLIPSYSRLWLSGDFDQKPYVSNAADCSSVQLSGDEDYVLLACDGFFDVLRPADVPALVLEALRESGGSGQDVAQSLVAEAKAAGSSDNITVLLVFLREPRDLLLSEPTAGKVWEDETRVFEQTTRGLMISVPSHCIWHWCFTLLSVIHPWLRSSEFLISEKQCCFLFF